MKGWILAGLLGLALAAAGQEVPPRTAFEVADLELVSYEALTGGTTAHSGPVCAAIVMAWFSERGYPAFRPDLNNDGRTDEADTLLLAARFAKDMGIQPDRPAADPRLMDVLARYVSERYPREFVLKLWDDSFGEEYRAVFGKPFDPGDYPLIKVALNPNASHTDYVGELLSAEGVILGLGRERTTNTYFVGRSFEFEEKPDGWPIDVVDTGDDLSLPGLQGQVFPTVMREGEDHWLVRYAGWVPLEFMLSLSPIRKPSLGTPPGPCSAGAIGHDVVTVDSEWGSFRVEECVTRDGDRDIYSYRVTNLSFVYNGCGICEFFVPNFHGFPTLDQWGPSGWLVNPWGSWSWAAPLGDCGIPPGATAEFGVAVPAPTTDTWQPAAVGGCLPLVAVAVVLPPHVKFKTTGPGPGEEIGCPDLTVVKLTACWRYTPRQEIEVVVTAVVQNIGTVASGSFWVNIDVTSSLGGGSDLAYVANLAPSATTTISSSAVVGSPGAAPFPINVTVTVDYFNKVAECKETNNEATFIVGRANTCR